mmetsp:Transcript_23216/g.50956  ORF Transcript_23216/g.50956 Transcript_23216/m.50956 type:complete len:123 (+) Transcript_23216:896-1264(+)
MLWRGLVVAVMTCVALHACGEDWATGAAWCLVASTAAGFSWCWQACGPAARRVSCVLAVLYDVHTQSCWQGPVAACEDADTGGNSTHQIPRLELRSGCVALGCKRLVHGVEPGPAATIRTVP